MLDANDPAFAQFKVMITNADGSTSVANDNIRTRMIAA
jgi:hypothetical protein